MQHFLKEAQESNRQAQRPEESTLTHYSYRDTQPQSWNEAEEAVQDGFLFRAKDMPSRNLISSAETTKRQLVGSTVAWSSSASASNTVAVGNGDASMHVGTVLAVNLGDEIALVELIRNWEGSLPEVADKDLFVVNSCSTGSSAWIQMKNLHVISSGAPLNLQNEFSNEVAPTLLEEAKNRCQQVTETADTSNHSIPSTRSHVRTTRSIQAALDPECDMTIDAHASNIFDSELQDASVSHREQSSSQTSKQAKNVRKKTIYVPDDIRHGRR